MKTLTLIILLTTSQFANALTPREKECLARNIYWEARGEDKKIWSKVARVALNRKKNYKFFKAKSSNICDIVSSNQYTSHKSLKTKIRELKRYKEIKIFVERERFIQHSALYFSGIGNLRFRREFQ